MNTTPINQNYTADLSPPRRDHFFNTNLYRGPRENHTQKKYVPAAIALALVPERDGKAPAPKDGATADGAASIMNLRSYSTLRLNRSNVKRKAAARGRMRSL